MLIWNFLAVKDCFTLTFIDYLIRNKNMIKITTKHPDSPHNYVDHNSKMDITYNIFLSTDHSSKEVTNWKERLEDIIKNMPERDDTFKPLVQFLVTTIRPAKIYKVEYSPSLKSEEAPFTDLLLVIPASDHRNFKELETFLEVPYLPNHTIRLKLYKEELILNRLENGHIFFSRHCVAENLLYDDGKRLYPTTSPQKRLSLNKQAVADFKASFKKGIEFLKSAKYWINNPPADGLPGILLFFIHQVAELSYRSIIQFQNGSCPKTHEIRSLRTEVSRFAPHLAAIFKEDNKEDTRLIDLLESGYLESRYSLEFTITNGDLSKIFDKILTLNQAAYAHFVHQIKGSPDENEEEFSSS